MYVEFDDGRIDFDLRHCVLLSFRTDRESARRRSKGIARSLTLARRQVKRSDP